MTKRVLFLLLAVLFAAVSVGCADEETAPAESGVALNLYALDSACSGGGDGLASLTLLKVKVVSKATDKVEVLADEEFPASAGSITLDGIPEGTDIEVSILGVSSDPSAPPVAYARVSDLVVTQGETTNVTTTLSPYSDYGCVDKPSGAPNLMFSTSTALPDGRVLVAGGFSKVVEESGRFEIGQASPRAFIYDPSNGTIDPASSEMNKGRGAHAAAYLPKSKLVLLVGGAERMYMEKDTGCFPWYFLKEKAGTVGFTYELFDPATNRFLAWNTEEWPDDDTELVTKARRVFPQLSVNNDGTVLVTGGGHWPSCQTKTETDTDYQTAELYRPKSASYSGTFMDSYGALTMKAMRSGHSAVLLEVKDKRATHLFWGGTEDGPVAELYTEASGQMDGTFGVFTPVEFLDSGSYGKRPYFHSFTPLRDRQFLLVGGVTVSNAKMKVPSAGDSYLVAVKSNSMVGVSSAGGLEYGRYFHSATAFDAETVVIAGGFGAVVQGEDSLFANGAMDDVRFYSLTTGEMSLPPVDMSPLPRGGHVAQALPNDCILSVGGVDQPHAGLEFGPSPVPLLADIYCASVVCPETLWQNTCYQE